MAWGLWNKIKQGFKKVGGAIKKAATFVNDKVIKPFKPVISQVADKFIPGGGKIVEELSDGIDEIGVGRGKEWAINKLSMVTDPRTAYETSSNRPGYKKLNF